MSIWYPEWATPPNQVQPTNQPKPWCKMHTHAASSCILETAYIFMCPRLNLSEQCLHIPASSQFSWGCKANIYDIGKCAMKPYTEFRHSNTIFPRSSAKIGLNLFEVEQAYPRLLQTGIYIHFLDRISPVMSWQFGKHSLHSVAVLEFLKLFNPFPINVHVHTADPGLSNLLKWKLILINRIISTVRLSHYENEEKT